MSLTLAIRNLTPTSIELKFLERYSAVTPAPNNPIHLFTNLASNVTSVVGVKPSSSRSSSVAENAQAFSREEVNLWLDPFTTKQTDNPLPERGEILRLTFEADGEQYRIDLPLTKGHSNDLVPLGSNSQLKIGSVFVPGDSFLALFSSANLSDWMSELNDSTPISALSIPGTHNSPTCHKALPSVRCQAVSPKEQLDNGVRFFDIRVQPQHPEDPSKDGLILVHGVFPISLTGSKHLRGLLKDVESFLAAHPRETVILSIKREGPGEHTDQQLARIVRDHYANDPAKWYTDPRIPPLGQVRGKMVLMRRFALDDAGIGANEGRGWAIDAQHWAYNTSHDTQGEIVVQDLCEVLETQNIDQKIEACCAQLGRSGTMTFDTKNESKAPPLYLNFLSASNFWNIGCWPERIAAKLNPAVLAHLCVKHVVENEQADWCTGIVICDWVGAGGDWDLVRAIVGMNSKLMVRQRT
jgi:1-phosphatidylinositol phosphodiesterase